MSHRVKYRQTPVLTAPAPQRRRHGATAVGIVVVLALLGLAAAAPLWLSALCGLGITITALGSIAVIGSMVRAALVSGDEHLLDLADMRDGYHAWPMRGEYRVFVSEDGAQAVVTEHAVLESFEECDVE